MAHLQGATIEVISGHKSCPVYDDPDADGRYDPFSIHFPQKYIEAVPGANFAVMVTLDPDFPFAGCDAVRVNAYFDGPSHGYYGDIKRTDAIAGGRSIRFSTMRSYCVETGQWQAAELSFGELRIQEASDPTISVRDVKDLGTIKVTWQRIYLGEDVVRDHHRDGYRGISEVSEKVLKGKAIENTIKKQSQDEHPISLKAYATPVLIWSSALIHGTGTLQMLGCIPRPASPEPLRERLGGSSTKIDDPEEEKRVLRARLAELENRTKTPARAGIKAEQNSTLGIKREREDKENATERKRNRKLGPVEVVDLTAD
ncbi:MAG: hypothetical protein Q9166_001398 [cf. Caloplaca sp. 2 TL-2023]